MIILRLPCGGEDDATWRIKRGRRTLADLLNNNIKCELKHVTTRILVREIKRTGRQKSAIIKAKLSARELSIGTASHSFGACFEKPLSAD